MTTEGVDFSFARPNPTELVAAKKQFVVRYITGSGGKALTAAEVAAYHGVGLAIALVFESTANRALSGRTAGQSDAHTAVAAADALGFPATTPIYFACDFNATSLQYPAIDAYLNGAASVIGGIRVGVYGHAKLMDHCASAHTAAWFWQTYAWSGGVVSSHANLFQYKNGQTVAGGPVDLCLAMKPAYGQWSASPTAPDTSTGEPPMPLIPQALGHVVITATENFFSSPDIGSKLPTTFAVGKVLPKYGGVPGWQMVLVNYGTPAVPTYGWVRSDHVNAAPGALTVIDGPLPVADCSAVQHELDIANSRIQQGVTALGGTI